MKHQSFAIIIILTICFGFNSCKKDSEPIESQQSLTAQDILKVGTTWIYENSYYDSVGVLQYSGPTYYDTTKIIRDTLINSQKWFITSSHYSGGNIYVVNAIGLLNGEYWKLIRARSTQYDTLVMTPLFKKNLNKDDSFENVYCLLAAHATPIMYKRTVVTSSINVSLGDKSYDCVYLKETKLTPDNLLNFEYQNYYYNSVYGLIKNEWYMKSSGGTIYRQSISTLHEVKIPM